MVAADSSSLRSSNYIKLTLERKRAAMSALAFVEARILLR
jgi:hypothetical protein